MYVVAEDGTNLIQLDGNVISVLANATIFADSTASVVVAVPSVTNLNATVTVNSPHSLRSLSTRHHTLQRHRSPARS